MITGSLPALVTPFANGKVDVDALKKLVDWHIDQGSHGLVPVGTTGESPTLTHEEHDRVVEVVVAQATNIERVVSIERKHIRHGQATARSQWQAIDVLALADAGAGCR